MRCPISEKIISRKGAEAQRQGAKKETLVRRTHIYFTGKSAGSQAGRIFGPS
jgi:hypothetical protein